MDTRTSPGPAPTPSAGSGVVTGTGTQHRPRPGATRRLGRREHPGHERLGAQRHPQQVRAVGTRGRRPVAGAAGIATIGDQVVEGRQPPEPPGEPVMRQADRGRALGVVRLMLGQPPQFRHRERRNRDRAHRLRPGEAPGRPAAEVGDEVGGRRRGPDVVPQQGRANHPPVLVQADHAVLLAGDRHRGHVVESAGPVGGLPQGRPPGVGVDLGAVGMLCPALAYEGPRGGVADHHLAGLGGRVDPGDQWHLSPGRVQRAPSTCSTASCCNSP